MDNNEIINDILKDFKLLNSIDNAENDNLFMLYIKKAAQAVLNLTNRYKFPEELRYVVLDLAEDFYTNNSILGKITNSETTGNIKSISEAGRQVTFGSAEESTINSLLSNYINQKLQMRMKEIYRYRLLYKVKKDGQN